MPNDLCRLITEARAGVLPKAFRDESFAFNGTVLSGQPEEQPRWKRAVNATNGALGEAVGRAPDAVGRWSPAR